MNENEYTLDELNKKVSDFKAYLLEVVKKNNVGIGLQFSTESHKSSVLDVVIDVKVLTEIRIIDL